MANNSSWNDIPFNKKLELLKNYEKWIDTRNQKFERKVRWPGYSTETLKRRLRELRTELNTAETSVDVEETQLYDDQGPVAEQISIEEDGVNEKVVSARKGRIWTVEQLLTAMDISLDEWAITKIIANKWEGYRKNAKKDIVWEGGKIVQGEIHDQGDLFIAPLIQVKIWLVRREPVAVNPLIVPVVINLPRVKVHSTYVDKSVKTALIVPDNHYGFLRDYRTGKLDPIHDRRAHDIVLQIANTYSFDRVVLLGDLMDFAAWSDKFLRSPEFVATTQPALIEAAWWLARLSLAQPHAEKDIIEGNHDARMNIKIMTSVAEGYDLRAVDELDLPPAWSVPKLLNTYNLGYNWVGDYPNGKVWLNPYLALEHGAVAQGRRGSTVDTINGKRTYSTIIGHIHGAEMTSRVVRTREGKRNIFALCPGFLGRLDGIVPGHKDNQEWSNGFAIVHYTDDGYAQPTHIPIEDGVALYDGKAWVGVDHTEELIDFAGSSWGF